MVRNATSLLSIAIALWAAICFPALAAPPLQSDRVHVVQPGDTLGYIAARYATTLAELVAANDMSDPDHIVVGQQLRIPSHEFADQSTALHVVQAGDTLSVIALQHQISAADLMAANGLPDPDFILIGQRLRVPGSVSGSAETQLPAPFAEVGLSPNPAIQGQTVVLHARMSAAMSGDTVRGSILEQDFDLIGETTDPGGRWGIVGIPAMTEPGRYPLWLSVEGHDAQVCGWLSVVAGQFDTDYIQLSAQTSQLLDATLIQNEWAKLNQYWSFLRPAKLWEKAFNLPVATGTRVSSAFGTRRSYNGQLARSYHEGIDFAAPIGTPVHAPSAGKVVLAEELNVRGNGILIDHGWGVVSGYFHLSRLEVPVGQWVEPGDILGQVGSTGLSTGDHLHWEVRIRSVPVDPLQWTQRHLR
jgi:murein DD-endopeptidase MepM/ murein hydrolase activator NlpD